MKKRLLSAALALAMVLTMLPLTAFAAPDPTEPAYYFAQGAKFTSGKESGTNKENADTAGWYTRVANTSTDTADKQKYPYIYTVVSGDKVISGLNATASSATLYNSLGHAVEWNATQVTLLGSGTNTLNAGDVKSGSLSINMNGKPLNITGETPKAKSFSTLTITDTATSKGTLTGSITAKSKGFTLSVTGTDKVSSNLAVVLDNTTETATTNQSFNLQVTVDNAKIGDITTKNSKGNITVRNGGETGAIKLGDATDATYEKGNRAGGSITVNNSKTGTIDVVGTTNITVEQMGTTGKITMVGGTKTMNTADTSKVPTWSGTTLTVRGRSTVYGISQDTTVRGGDAVGHSITVDDSTVWGDLTTNGGGRSTVKLLNGTTVTSGVSMNYGTLDINKTTITGSVYAATGTDAGQSLAIKVGSTTDAADKPVIGGFNNTSGGGLVSLTINSGTIGTIGNGYTKTINGGTFTNPVGKSELSAALQKGYVIQTSNSPVSYTYTTNFQDLIEDYRANNVAGKNLSFVKMVADPGTSPGSMLPVIFKWNATDTSNLATVYVTNGSFVTLPSMVNKQQVAYWYDASTTGDAGNITGSNQGIPAGSTPYITRNTVFAVHRSASTTNQITKVTAVDQYNSNAPIGCSLSGTTISLSGAVRTTTAGNILISIEFDGKSAAANLRTVAVGWNPANKAIVVGATSGEGVTKGSKDNTIRVYDTEYTITDGGLSELNESITIQTPNNFTTSKIVVPNANAGLSGNYTALGAALKATLESTGADFSGAYGIQAALNDQIGKLNVTSLINTACSSHAAYINAKDKPTPAAKASDYTASFKYLVVTPYLEVTASNYKPTAGNPEITLNITPKYRYQMSNTLGGGAGTYAMTSTKDANGNYKEWEQTGSITAADYGPVEIQLIMPAAMKFGVNSDSYIHHNGYVYPVKWGGGTTATFETVNGFSPFVINNTAPKYSITVGRDTTFFETLQDAVDAVKNSETIEVSEDFNGTINLSGAARTFTIKGKSDASVYITGVNGASSTFKEVSYGNEYQVQLTTNTLTPSGNVAISVASVANGYARVSASSVKPGTVVTITATPNAGYVAGTPSVRYTTKTSTNNVLNVAAAGTNTWTFTVPTDATGVTVTPSFVRTVTSTLPFNDVATNAWYYSGVEYCWNTTRNGYHLMEGVNSNNTQFSPNNTFTRAQMVQVLWNIKGRPTPGAARKTYTDVSPNQWYYNAIVWATNNGYADGFGDGRFGPDRPVKRDELVEFLWKFAGRPSGTGNLNVYADRASVPLWAQNSMRWATGYNILSGQNSVSLGSLLSAESYAMRSEVAVTVTQYHGRYGG